MTAVRCVDLCKTYRQGDQDIKALDHVSIEIEKGGFVCLSAPSGGGKTTLLNAIGGLDMPDSGEVWVADKRIDLARALMGQLGLDQGRLRFEYIGAPMQGKLLETIEAMNAKLRTLGPNPAADVKVRGG